MFTSSVLQSSPLVFVCVGNWGLQKLPFNMDLVYYNLLKMNLWGIPFVLMVPC
uniref:Uncharacterized protein n=1 Tax=Arundo donax TaxID=35708 RepID=A0A0A9CF41_ARUDO